MLVRAMRVDHGVGRCSQLLRTPLELDVKNEIVAMLLQECRQYQPSSTNELHYSRHREWLDTRHATRDTRPDDERIRIRTRDERLAAVVESIAEKLEDGLECVPAVYRQAVGAEQESATPLNNRELHSFKMVEAAGIEPVSLQYQTLHQPCKCIALQCVPRIHKRAPLQEDCTKIAVLCIKTMPYLCHRIWQM